MSKDDRIQQTAASTPTAPQTAVQTSPTAPATTPAKPAPLIPEAVKTRLSEMAGYIKPYLTPRLFYIVLAIVLVIAGYYFIDAFFFDKRPNSERWAKWLNLDDPTDVRATADKVFAEEPQKTNPNQLPVPDWNNYQTYKVYRRLLDDFAKSGPDTMQARVARVQLGRFLMIVAMREIGSAVGGREQNHAVEILETVVETFEKLEPQLAADPTLQEEVILTQGKARETLGELDKAEALYRKLADSEKTKNGAAGKEATACLARLKDPKARQEAIDLAERFVKQTAKPAGP